MARIRFRKPKIAVLMSEIISLTIWLFLGDKVINVLDTLIGQEYDLNISGTVTTVEGCDNNSNFEDAWEIMGLGYGCEDYDGTGTQSLADLDNTDSGLLGVIALVMVVMVLMNFVTYS